jgi:hypothetical protein
LTTGGSKKKGSHPSFFILKISSVDEFGQDVILGTAMDMTGVFFAKG